MFCETVSTDSTVTGALALTAYPLASNLVKKPDLHVLVFVMVIFIRLRTTYPPVKGETVTVYSEVLSTPVPPD